MTSGVMRSSGDCVSGLICDFVVCLQIFLTDQHHVIFLPRATQWLTKGPIGDLRAVEAHSVSLSSLS